MSTDYLTKQEDIDLSVQILCSYCKDVFNEPVTLPCGQNICKCHIEEFLSNQNKKLFKCMLCKVDHQTDSNGSFPLNINISDLVKKCQVRATPIKDIHKTANESYNKLTGKYNYYIDCILYSTLKILFQ